MSVIDLISRWWSQEQIHWSLHTVSAPPMPTEPNLLPHGQAVQPHSAYLRLKMRSMAIGATRTGWSRFHAALYSQTSLALRDGNQATIQAVLSPDFFRNLDPRRLQNV